jgi:hypothetical protein
MEQVFAIEGTDLPDVLPHELLNQTDHRKAERDVQLLQLPLDLAHYLHAIPNLNILSYALSIQILQCPNNTYLLYIIFAIY